MKMRIYKKFAVIGLSMLVAVLVVVYLWPRDVVELKFATYNQAVAAGAVENSALPKFIPRTATDIRLVSNLDSNSSVITFKYGDEFEGYILAQTIAPAKSASDLGMLRQDSAFSDPRQLTYIPRINPDGESYRGSLLINRSKRRALYFE